MALRKFLTVDEITKAWPELKGANLFDIVRMGVTPHDKYGQPLRVPYPEQRECLMINPRWQRELVRRCRENEILYPQDTARHREKAVEYEKEARCAEERKTELMRIIEKKGACDWTKYTVPEYEGAAQDDLCLLTGAFYLEEDIQRIMKMPVEDRSPVGGEGENENRLEVRRDVIIRLGKELGNDRNVTFPLKQLVSFARESEWANKDGDGTPFSEKTLQEWVRSLNPAYTPGNPGNKKLS